MAIRRVIRMGHPVLRQPASLAAAYAAAGRHQEAVDTAELAARLARPVDPEMAKGIESRLRLYRMKRSYRSP